MSDHQNSEAVGLVGLGEVCRVHPEDSSPSPEIGDVTDVCRQRVKSATDAERSPAQDIDVFGGEI